MSQAITTPTLAETAEVARISRKEEFRTAFSLTSEEIQEANLATIEAIKRSLLTPPEGFICHAGSVVLWGHEQIKNYMGLVEMTETETDTPHLFRWKTGKNTFRRWKAVNNAANRKLTDTNWEALLKFFMEVRWALTGETCIRDEMNRVLSAQHRMVAAFIATLLNPSLKFYFIIIDGVSHLVADFIDTGKSRDQKDISTRHTASFLPIETLRMLNDSPYLADVLTVRTSIVTDINQAVAAVWHRGHGQDVNASTTKYKSDRNNYQDMLARFEPMEFVDANGVVVESTTLERAAMRIYAYDKEKGGILHKYYGRGNVLAATILASNTDNESAIRVEKTDNDKDVVQIELPETLHVNFDLLEEFCQVACDKVGAFQIYYYDKTKKSNEELKRWKSLKFAILVNAIRHFKATRQESVLDAIINEAGEVTSPAKTVIGCSMVAKLSDLLPKLPKPKPNPKTGLDMPIVFNIPHFGGYDCGLLDKDTIKSDAALQAAQDEYATEATETSE